MDLNFEINGWVAFGFMGQAMFSMRFILQWISSERAKKSVVPVVFWYFSLFGSLILFNYALWYLHDPVITIGQSTGVFIYLRNLYFIHFKNNRAENIPDPSERRRKNLVFANSTLDPAKVRMKQISRESHGNYRNRRRSVLYKNRRKQAVL